jgi:putative ABC transport system permease protein
VTIIGIIDSKIGTLSGLYTNQKTVDAVYPASASTSWYVALQESADADQVAKEIESALLFSGVQGTSIRDELRDAQKTESGFLYIIQGFMGLGLFVGVAAVGVIAFRSVVERRQQIGVLRAIGFQREMVSLAFLIETLFIVGLGVLSGAALGLRLGQKLVEDPDQGFSADASFVIPWSSILPIVAVTIVVALVMTWIPARQAGRVAPAEALRYE